MSWLLSTVATELVSKQKSWIRRKGKRKTNKWKRENFHWLAQHFISQFLNTFCCLELNWMVNSPVVDMTTRMFFWAEASVVLTEQMSCQPWKRWIKYSESEWNYRSSIDGFWFTKNCLFMKSTESVANRRHFIFCHRLSFLVLARHATVIFHGLEIPPTRRDFHGENWNFYAFLFRLEIREIACLSLSLLDAEKRRPTLYYFKFQI